MGLEGGSSPMDGGLTVVALKEVPDTIRDPIPRQDIAFPDHENPPTSLRKLRPVLGVARYGALQFW